MLVMDGIEIIENICVFEEVWCNVFVIVLMVDVMFGDCEKYIFYGMNGYVLKLIDVVYFVKEMVEVLDGID